MATGWLITIGYNQHHDECDIEAIKALHEAARKIASEPWSLAREAVSCGAPSELDGEHLFDYCTIYQSDPEDGGPMSIIFDEHNYEKCGVHIMASGGDPSRTMKEHVGRAFCRLIIREMHRQGIDVHI